MTPTVRHHMIISALLPIAALMPNAGAQPHLQAGAQRTLEGVGCSAWFGGVRPVL